MTRVFKVYDDEWEKIIGEEQLKEFALHQMTEKFNTCNDEEIEDDIDTYISNNYKDEVRKVIKLFPNDEQVNQQLTIPLAIEMLKLRYFDVEELNVY